MAMMMLPENVVSSRKALPSPTTPRTERRHRPRSASPLLANEKSERMEPLNDVASTSNPALPGSVAVTVPEWDVIS